MTKYISPYPLLFGPFIRFSLSSLSLRKDINKHYENILMTFQINESETGENLKFILCCFLFLVELVSRELRDTQVLFLNNGNIFSIFML